MVNTLPASPSRRARAIGARHIPGKVSDEVLENENGRDSLRYPFYIKRGNTAIS